MSLEARLMPIASKLEVLGAFVSGQNPLLAENYISTRVYNESVEVKKNKQD
jgi:hypothetical protein